MVGKSGNDPLSSGFSDPRSDLLSYYPILVVVGGLEPPATDL